MHGVVDCPTLPASLPARAAHYAHDHAHALTTSALTARRSPATRLHGLTQRAAARCPRPRRGVRHPAYHGRRHPNVKAAAETMTSGSTSRHAPSVRPRQSGPQRYGEQVCALLRCQKLSLSHPAQMLSSREAQPNAAWCSVGFRRTSVWPSHLSGAGAVLLLAAPRAKRIHRHSMLTMPGGLGLDE